MLGESQRKEIRKLGTLGPILNSPTPIYRFPCCTALQYNSKMYDFVSLVYCFSFSSVGTIYDFSSFRSGDNWI